MTSRERFDCDCGGSIQALAEDRVLHACRLKYAPATSYYDGVDRPVQWRRVQINPALTDGRAKYNWFVAW
jgi:hypothetical protein